MSLLLLVLASIASLVTMAIFFVIGQHRRARRILIRWGIGVAAYAGILVAMAGQAVNTTLTFKVPSDTRPLFFNAGVNGIQYASFVNGNGDVLHRPRIRFRIE